MESKKDVIFRSVAKFDSDPDMIITILNQHLKAAHDQPNAKIKKVPNKPFSITYEACNAAYTEYNTLLHTGNIDEEILAESASKYNSLRNQLTVAILKQEHSKWVNATNNDAKTLWQKIDWTGTLHANPVQNQPDVNDIAAHFEEVYRADDQNELSKIHCLRTNVTKPELDNPISSKEVNDSVDEMKKGGYDYPLNIVQILQALFLPILVILMNLMFYVKYPKDCLLSLLFAIPKKGGATKAFNYRGIQMMTAIACLFDRILAARLDKWLPISDEQSAYQKGKSTMNHLFTLLLIIELAKLSNKPVFIGFFDISKAFDRVSRLILLKKLIAKGIGRCMLKALQSCYSLTECIVSSNGEYSNKFPTNSGIRQGATSSAKLFIFFMDGLIQHLKQSCDPEDCSFISMTQLS